MSSVLLMCWITLFVKTDSSPTVSPIYELKGASVHLTVEGLQRLQIRRITWSVNSILMLEYTVGHDKPHYYPEYKEKMQFDSSDFSLLIKNLEETDQGTYTAKITETNGTESEKAKYRLHVQEAVAKPIIQMNNSTLDSAEGFCTVSVNCSVKDSWVYYTCDQTQCLQTEPQSWPNVNITVTVYNGSIICTGSNRVSNKTQSEPLGHACEGVQYSALLPPSGLSPCLLKILLFSVGLVIMISAVITVHLKDRFCRLVQVI
nr:T-lymphocyte activation antigen CD80-like isoform X1 [Paramormyrops kingsleyae]